jgi:DNA-binding MarR family transcriptional regulator
VPVDPIDESRRDWDRQWGPDAGVALAAVSSIMRAQQILLARLNEVLKPAGLTFPRYEALMVLQRSGRLPLSRLGERLQVHKATVTDVVDRLERRGLVARVPDPRDRRTIFAEITADGLRVAEAAGRALAASQFGIGELDAAQLEELYELLRRLRV